MDATLLEAIERSPDYWSGVLFRAMRESDLATAAAAQERLLALGVSVSFPGLFADGLDDIDTEVDAEVGDDE